jgi:ATP-dependent Clp protease ATP-binding subunit ClpB
LKRAIQRLIQDPLALKVLEGEFSEGDTIEVDAGPGDALTFSKKVIRVKGKAMSARA